MKTATFEKVKNKFGFGLMRLPMLEDKVDHSKVCEMVDEFIAAGFNYFDTAHGYIDGKSELAVKECLSSRYNREDYVLANKLSDWFFEKEEDIVPLFEKQLQRCGVEYFDFYLFHSITQASYNKHKQCNSFNIIKNLKAQGKIRHIAMSFHDSADVLDKILSEQSIIEAVQLQINYLDYDDPTVQSKACYDVAVKHGKKVIVMEPVRGGALVNLPEKAKAEFDALQGGSYASYALRYAASYPEVFMVLSGMGNMDMVKDNIKTMSDFVPLNARELKATDNARNIIREYNTIPCTGCNYCADVCPKDIRISETFSLHNNLVTAKISKNQAKETFAKMHSGAEQCIECGKCEEVCPQSIKIRDNLNKIVKNIG